MFYEYHHSLDPDLLKLQPGECYSFPLHLQGSFELVTVYRGKMQMTVDKNVYVLQEGDALLIFPNQLHSILPGGNEKHMICIFSPTLVQGYAKLRSGLLPKSNLFRPDPFYLARLQTLNGQDTIAAKGLLYALCAEFDSQSAFAPAPQGSDGLLRDIFRFVEENFHTDCSLSRLSERTSYHYVYLSRYFKQCTGLSFIDYVNQHRIEHACYLLRNSPQPVLQIAYDCGFSSLRSFNRNFKQITGFTPTKYRNGK